MPTYVMTAASWRKLRLAVEWCSLLSDKDFNATCRPLYTPALTSEVGEISTRGVRVVGRMENAEEYEQIRKV